MPVTRSRQRSASINAWRRYLPVLDSAVASDWPGVSRLLREPDFSQADFLSFVTDHDLAATFHWLVQRDEASAQLPSWLLLHLIGTAAYGVRRRQELIEALAEIASAAQSANLTFLLLKGLHFAERFYGCAGGRWSRDLDLLVKAEDQAASCRLLTNLGYHSHAPAWIPIRFRNYLAHASNWQRREISVDLHHDFRVRPAYRIDVNRIFSASQQQTIAGIHLAAPADEDCLLLLLVSIASDIEQGRICAKSLVDFWALLTHLEGRVQWENFFADRVSECLHRLVREVLLLLMVSLPHSARFPRLQEALQKQIGADRIPDQEAAIALLSAPPYSLANRRWFLRHYEGNTLAYLNWWLIGGIFRSGSVWALGRAMLQKR